MQESDLLRESERVFQSLSVTLAEAQYLALSTRLQSKSQLWFEHRKGRITVSLFGDVCRTSVSNPSQSLLDRILQVKGQPRAASLRWGTENEEVARLEYQLQVKNQHRDLDIDTTGLCVNPKFPHLGASPDGLISCSCCGRGVLEINVPSVFETVALVMPLI